MMYILLRLLFSAQSSFAADCFTQHLQEAIQVHQIRFEEYSRLTQGASEKISNRMVFLNRIGIPFARYFDQRSKEIQTKNKLPFLCEVIPPMLSVLSRKIVQGPSISMNLYEPFSASSANHAIRKAYHQRGLLKVQHIVQQLKMGLELQPHFYCLARQFVLSMDKIIHVYSENPSPQSEKLTWDMIQMALLQLRLLVHVDRLAVPIQAQGIPILCNELPELPRFP